MLLVVYLVASRSLVVVLGLYLVLYFLLSSRPMKDFIQQAVSDAIPGTIGACVVQWGPLPWHVRIAEGRVFGERGEELIRVRGVDATIDLGATLESVIAFLHDPTVHDLRVHLERVDLLEPWARVEVHDDGWVGLEYAFDDHRPSAPGGGDGLVFELSADVVRVLDGSGRVDAPGFHLEAGGLDTVTNYLLRVDTDFHMAFDAPRAEVPWVEMTFTTFSHLPEPLQVSARDLVAHDFAWRGLGFTWRDAEGVLGDDAHARFSGSGGLDAAPHEPTWQGQGHIAFDDDAPEIGRLTRGLVSGPLELAIGGGGDVEQLAASWRVDSPELTVDSLVYQRLHASGRITPRGSPAVPDRHAIHVDHGEAMLGAGSVTLDALAWEPRTDDYDPRDLALSLRVEDVDVGAALVAMFGPAVPLLPEGRWTGAADVALHPRPDVEGDVLTVDVDQAEVTWRTPPLPGLAPTWSFAGRATRATGATGLPLGRDLGPFDALDLRGLVLDVGSDRARLAGTIDLLSGAIDLEPYARIGDLAPLARNLGLGDLAGRLVLKAARARGTLLEPRLEGTLNWTEARIGDRVLGQVKGQLGFANGTLTLRELASQSAIADFALDLDVRLLEPGLRASPDFPFELRARRLHGVLASAIGPWFGPDARIAIDAGEFRGRLSDPLASLAGGGRLVVSNAAIAGETGVRLEAEIGAQRVSAKRDALTLDDVAITLQSGAVWRGRLHVEHPPGSFARPEQVAVEGQLELADTSLANLRPIARGLPELSAIARGRLNLGGTLARPAIIGTLEIEDAVIDRLVLGDAHLAVTTRDDVVEISAFDRDLFGGFALERASLTLDGFSPRRFEAAVRVNDKDLAELVPDLRDSAVELVGSTTAEVEVDLATSATSFRVRSRPGELELSVPDRGVRWTNASELLVVSDRGGFVVHPVTLGPAGALTADAPSLAVCGAVGADTIDLQLAGSVDLAVVPGLADLFSVSEGRLEIAADPTVAAAVGDSTCLQNTRALLVLGGSPTAPVAIGSLEASGLTLVPRGSGREIRLRRGATVQLRKGARAGEQRVVLGAGGSRFEGDLDDGSFGLSGELLLARLAPVSLDLRLIGADLYFQSAGEFAFTASPNARIVGQALDTAAPSLSVGGDLTLSEGRFSKSFDTFARAVGGALGVKGGAYTTSLLDDLPWVGKTALDVNVVASDFQIQSALPLARTDLPARLDLTLRGTIAEPRLFRRIDLLAGGTLTYLVFERTFVVSQGAIDFDGDPERPLVEITAQTQITYLQRAQTALQEEDEKEVAVTLRMTGRVPDLKIELSSDDPSLDQADIQSLLITGKPRGDLDRAQESRVVSADLANVINTVLSAPFVRTASVGVDQKGGFEYRVGTCFAPNLCFDTTTLSDDTETTLRAKFSLSIGDDVVCEGTLKRSDTGATSAQETYQARCRYRIPLE